MHISKQLINGFIKSELEDFIKQFDETPIKEKQETRSLAIAWLCYFFKDIITNENLSAIVDFVDDVETRKNYKTHGWYRVSALQAASFVISSDIYYANMLIHNIKCGRSWAIGYILSSSAIICPLLSFDNMYLKNATETNIKHHQAYYTESAILYLSTNGTVEEKQRWFENIIDTLCRKADSKVINKFKEWATICETTFFVNTFNRIKSYILFKILAEPIVENHQLNIYDYLNAGFDRLLDAENDHPLNRCYIDFGFLKK